MNKTQNPLNFEPSHLHRKGDLSPVRPREKMPTVYRHRRPVEEPTKEGLQWPKDNSFLRKRLDRTV